MSDSVAWKQHEADIAQVLHGRQTKSSGAWYDRGDGKHAIQQNLSLLWECKCTAKDRFRVSSAVWRALQEKALYREPVLFVRFISSEGQVLRDWALCRTALATLLGVDTDITKTVGGTQVLHRDEERACLVVKTPLGLEQPLWVLAVDEFVERYWALEREHGECSED